MAGSFVAYHLRQNKAVDRALFAELLKKVSNNPEIDIEKYTYVGFGGAFLEDFRQYHYLFGFHNMISIEGDKKAFKRQRINKSLKCIKRLFMYSDKLIGNYYKHFIGDNHAIVWLDYADRKKTRIFIDEFQQLVTKSKPMDIVRITLNAFMTDNDRSSREKMKSKCDVLLEDLSPSILPLDALNENGYVKILLNAIRTALNSIQNRDVILLMALKYNDSSQVMLTVTCMVIEKDNMKLPEIRDREKQELISKMKIQEWEWYANDNWDVAPLFINIPELSISEKSTLEHVLPQGEINSKVKILFDQDDDISIRLVDNYKKVYRFSPAFGRILV